MEASQPPHYHNDSDKILYFEMPPYKLISASTPGSRHVGEILIQDMLSALPDHQIDILAVTTNPNRNANLTPNRHLEAVSPPLESETYSHGNFLSRQITALRRAWSYERFAKRKAEEIFDRYLNNSPHSIWSILDSTAVIDITYHLIKRHPANFFVQIWDDPKHLIFLKNLDPISSKRTLSRFEFILRNAHKVAVICEQMQASYRNFCNQEPIIIRHGLHGASSDKPNREPDNTFRIGFCGSMYATTAWKAFMKALNSKQWKLNGKSVQLVIASSAIELEAGTQADVRFHGWQTPDDTAKLMGECDLLYLPQGFAPGQRPITELSFPTKLSTYAATGRAIFVHSPHYGSLSTFCKLHDFGVLCNELDAKSIAEQLEKLAATNSLLEHASNSTLRVRRELLSPATFASQVRTFLAD